MAARENDIRAIAVELIESFAKRDNADFAAELAEPLPVRVISDMLGIERADHGEVSNGGDPRSTCRRRRDAESLRGWLRDPRLHRRDGRGTPAGPPQRPHERHRERDDRRCSLSPREVLGMAMLLYAAGNETTAMLIGSALWLLDRHPYVRERLRATPNAIPSAIEEILRFEHR